MNGKGFLNLKKTLTMQRTNKSNQINKILNLEEPGNFDQFKDVELSEQEVQLALLQARQKKFYDKRLQDYKRLINETVKYPTYTSVELYTKVHEAGFTIDEYNKRQIWNLCQYFAGDPNGPLNPRKGIWLYGPVGCYKTSLMKFFANNQTNSFVVYNVMDISNAFQRDGHDGILRYKGLIPSTDTFRTFGQTDLGICFDDIGLENQDSKFFGNETNVMTEILASRHMSHENLIAKTHITSNINTTVIELRYGQRIRSRLREMVNLVEFPDCNPDRRK